MGQLALLEYLERASIDRFAPHGGLDRYDGGFIEGRSGVKLAVEGGLDEVNVERLGLIDYLNKFNHSNIVINNIKGSKTCKAACPLCPMNVATKLESTIAVMFKAIAISIEGNNNSLNL